MQVLKTYYNDAQMTDTNSLVNALMERPEELSPIITHLAGREEKKFPLSFLTEGVGNTKSIDRFEYETVLKHTKLMFVQLFLLHLLLQLELVELCSL